MAFKHSNEVIDIISHIIFVHKECNLEEESERRDVKIILSVYLEQHLEMFAYILM